MNNFINILDRIKKITGLKFDKEVAGLLGISSSQLSNIKRAAEGIVTTGSREKNPPFKQIIEWAGSNAIDLNYLFFGEQTQPKQTQPNPPWLQALEPFHPALDSLSEEEATCLAEIIEPLLRRGVIGTQPGIKEVGRPKKATKK